MMQLRELIAHTSRGSEARGISSRIRGASSLKDVFLAPNLSHLGDVDMVLFLSSTLFLLSEKYLE